MNRSVRAADSVVLVLRSFAVRGVVEGFYGTPWTHDARLEVISFLAARGMNAYAYAPKDDSRHRAEWRETYDSADLAYFGELAAHGEACGVQFGFAISPGLDIHYESATDRQTLLRKLTPLRDVGVSWFLLLLDDIPMQPGLASRQGALVTWLHSALAPAALTMCPTEYVGTHPSPYLSELGSGMPPDVDVMWTGPTVCSPHLRAADARGWTSALGDRRVIVWDNYPVNDALMTGSLRLGPYRGRDADLADVVGGVLCNPMIQARASLIALGTAMDFLGEPDGYGDASSWTRAVVDVGADRADAGLAALRLIQAARPVVTALPEVTAEPPCRGRAVGPDPEPAMHSAFMVLYVWKGARTDEWVVFGHRFAIYTPVVQMRDGAPALDVRAALREDANVIDRLCGIALGAYEYWRTAAAGTPLRVVVDGEEREVARDSSFDAAGRTITVRQGPISTRVTADDRLPFSGRRLA